MIVADAPIETFDEIDSTMMEASRRAARGDLGPVWLLAKKQNAGRGRRGRTWVSDEGNLYVTYLAPADRPPQELALVGFAAGLAICDAVKEEIGRGWDTRIKWPNDVMIEGAKASGLMLDSGATPDGRPWAALGLGVNLVSAPQSIDQLTTYLAAYQEPTDPYSFLSALRPRLAYWDEVLLQEGFEPLRAAWLDCAYGLGETIHVTVGAQLLKGRLAGLSPRGDLILDTESGRRLIAAGDVLLPNAV